MARVRLKAYEIAEEIENEKDPADPLFRQP